MRNIFTRLLVVSLLLLTTATLSAQQTSLTAGKVYKFTNCSYSTKVLASNGADDTRAADAVDGEKSQHWYCETETIDGTLYYKFKNLINGRYLAGNGTSSNWPLVAGDVETDTKYFTLETSGNYNVIRSKAHANNGYAYMHSDGSYNIVGWCTDASGNATSWTISEVEYTADDIASIFGEINTMENEVAAVSTYQNYLDNIFADKACTTFKQGYVFSENESNYQALPATLKNMVKKVSSNDWTEANGDASKEEWGHKYAKKFRVQMYEPYSIADERGIISFLRFNSHANNDNPTGIYAHERGNIYVMVQGEIKPGATLRLVDAGSNDRITYPTEKGYELKTGLNILPCYGQGGHFYVCYNVETYTPDTKEFNYKLSDFEPLKIHIEGGAINGFYNAQGDYRATAQSADDLWYQNSGASVDCDEDWEYMETRANLSVVPVLGHRQILLFSLNTTNEGDNGMAYYLPENINIPTTPYNRTGKWSDFGLGIPDEGYDGYKINIMMEAWDRIMYSELATMGLVSKDEMDKMNDLYPRWKADGSQAEMYDFNRASVVDEKTYQDFCEGRDYSEYFNHHGVALGVGGNAYMYGSGDHCGYHHNTMNGIIQNIAYTAGSTWGPAHEIGHQHQDTYLLNGQTEVTNNLFSNIALWYKGISTSRYNGNNGSLESVLNAFNTEGSDAYTNNIWALTHLYYRLWLYYHLAGKNTQFWPRLYELLRVDPLQNGGTISGDRSLLLFYKHACTAAGEDLTEFFRAHGFLSVMDNRLVGDYANAYYTVTQDMIDKAIDEVKAKGYEENLAILFINDDDETAKYVQHDGTTAREIYGETTPNSDFGSVSDFINGNVEVSTAYTASVSADGTVTMSSGEGGVGFLVLNEKGEIVSFSNKSTFAISDEAAYLLATGKATVVAVDTESNTTDAEVDVTAMRFALLQELIENATALTEKVSETRVGFYKATAVTSLAEYVEMAEEVIATNDLANLQAVYELLYNEYNSVVTNEYSRVTLVPGSKYAITSVKSNDRILTYSGSNVTTVSGNADAYSSNDAYQWYIERDGAYYIKNAGTSKYIQDVTDQNGVLYTVGDNKVNMNINEVALGCYTIATSTVPGRYMNMDGADATRIITWGDAYSENSQWAFILLDADDTNAAKEKLLELSNKTLTLVNEVATISYDEGSKITLQSSNENNANYIWSNAAVSNNNVDKLIDGDKGSYFHSQWSNPTVPADGWGHHISVDLGAGNTLASFKFKFTTRNASGLSNYPKTIEVYGSNDNSTYTKLQVVSGFATGKGVDNEAVVKGNGTAYRYLRFLVTDATGNNAGTNTGSDGMVFFHMSEFSIYPAVATVKEDYKSNITPEAVLAAYNDAESGKLIYNNTDATLDDINARTTALGDGTTKGSYTTLLAQYNNVLNSEINAKKEQLQTLIDETNKLISTVGSVTINPPTENELLLQVDNANASYYLSTNSQEGGDNRNIKNLLDGATDKANVYFHTDWQTSVGADHHLLLDMGDGKSLGTFTFEYTTRNNSAGIDAPTSIVVEGSNDNSSFTTIATLTGLPTGQHRTYTSETLGTNQNKYRYVRFRVTGGAGSVGGYYYFAMSEFDVTEVTETEITVTNNSSVVEDDLLIDTYLATTKSQKLHDVATTVALLDAAIADLQVAYNKLDEAIKTPVDLDKSGLEELIAATTALKSQLYKQAYTQGDALTLQADDALQAYYLYCNAPEGNAPDAADNVGVSALIDDDETNYLHTEWTGQQSADGLDHYLRVDLGEDSKLSDFVFSYKSARNLPRTFVVEGCNTADGEYERIGLYVGANTTNTLITSGLLGNGNEYRYLRFRVIATYSGGKDNSGYHYFFVLNDFDVYPATIDGVSSELKDEYASTIYIYTTSELVDDVTNGITQAQGVVDNADATQGDVDAELEELKAVYDKLEEALRYAALPVTITTDEANPVLYNIISKRATDDSKVLQYCEFDSENPNTVSVSDKAANNSYQAWYFMKSENGYLIKPFNGDGKVLAADDTSNGHTKVWAAEEDTKNYDEWTFVSRANGYYNIEVHDRSNYFSNNGGTDYKMGFWSKDPDTDDGSLFKFVEATFENDNARYYQLSDFENTLEYQTSVTPEGTTVGTFTNGNAYNTAYTTASTLIEAGNTSDAAACKDAYTALRAADADLEQNLPEEGKIYRIYITPGYTASDRTGASMRIDDNGKLYCDTYDESNARFYFTFEYDDDGNLYMKNLHSATYLDEALNSTDNNNVQVGADAEDIANAKKIAINTLGKSGDAVVVGIVPDGGDMLNCAGKPGNVVAYDNETVDKASAWVIEEVEPTTLEEKVKHTISLAPNTTGDDQTTGYSTLNLGYPVTVPAGVKAYIVTNSAIVDNTIELYEYASEGATIPANFPVILRGSTETVATREFQFKNSSVAAVDNVTNLLGGTNYTTYESCLNENGENVYNIYMLTRSGGIVAMRWAYENYDANLNYTGKNDDGGYVKCAANKVYLKLGGTSAANLSDTYYFSLFSGTTDIDKIESEENPLDGTIYDLQGRKIDEVKTPGFYIVNGKKMYVNTEMLK